MMHKNAFCINVFFFILGSNISVHEVVNEQNIGRFYDDSLMILSLCAHYIITMLIVSSSALIRIVCYAAPRVYQFWFSINIH